MKPGRMLTAGLVGCGNVGGIIAHHKPPVRFKAVYDMTDSPREDAEARPGKVVSVRGSVVDVRFHPPLPTRFQELRAGERDEIVLEVHSLLVCRRPVME